MGNLIGGRTSNVAAVELINTYAVGTFSVTLRVVNSTGESTPINGSYALLPDGPSNDGTDNNWRTRVDVSTTEDFSNLVYPPVFNMSAGERKIIYLKMYPTIHSTIGDGTFQIMLTGQPI
jgi:hypothetical protein